MLTFPVKFRKRPGRVRDVSASSAPPPAPQIVSIEPQEEDGSYCRITFDQPVSLGGTDSTLNFNATHGVWVSAEGPFVLLWHGEDNIYFGESWSWDSADPSVMPTPDPSQSGTVGE